MKVKFSNQVVRVNVLDPGYASPEDATKYINISSSFPDLAAGDAILIKKVVLGMGIDSEDIAIVT